ncbi:MAG: LL-diaminopimelate aminotransferase [Clostridia bacterium]|nr:LL-diaminopimelate aminotransferase [Clostridia bacterium]
MANINSNYLKLPGSYLFAEIARRSSAFIASNPDKSIIKLGIGDVTRPLPKAVTDAMHKAVDEMGCAETFRGYGPEQGYEFLREAITQHDYVKRGAKIKANEIFISDGAKSDCGNIGDIFGDDCTVAVCDPVYPVYVDTNAMAGRAGDYVEELGRWNKLIYMPCTKENNFVPELPAEKNADGSRCAPDMIYLCYPNNPTGAAITADELKKWVDYALRNESIILYDAAYEAYITEDLPHSIFEIEGAEYCAIEFRSFSKNAGFTGTRCGFTVIPDTVTARDSEGNKVQLNKLWNRRHCTKFNGVSYIIQRGAEAVYTPEGQEQTKELVSYYLENAKLIREGLKKAGFEVYGGVNAPYVWLSTPDNMDSWDFFDYLMEKAAVVGTPGSGFGPCGAGYFRLTGFGTYENTLKAIERISNI